MSDKRALAMLALYKQGATLQSIGNKYRLTRERVRQILAKSFGVARLDGGAHAQCLRRKEINRAVNDKYCMVRWGCTAEQKRQIASHYRKAWAEQKRNAKCRGISFRLSLFEFWTIWQQSGKWSERGRGAAKYCMSRVHDLGAYEVGNVRVITNAENCRLYQLATPSSHRRRPVELRGVYCVAPGAKRPYKAAFGRKFLGFFATESEAYQARRQHVEAMST